jgi:hypothetical protein
VQIAATAAEVEHRAWRQRHLPDLQRAGHREHGVLEVRLEGHPEIGVCIECDVNAKNRRVSDARRPRAVDIAHDDGRSRTRR